jgi:hypothetical protein
MAFEDSDRRRSVLLGLLTLIALPAIYIYSRSIDESADSGAAATEQSVDGVVLTTADSESTRPPIDFTEAEPIFLDGPVADLNPGVAKVAVPARPAAAPLQFSASYRSTVAGVRSCLVKELRSGLSVTVTNLDNSRSVTCVTSIAPFTQKAGLVMHTEAFSLLADLTEAPITVEVTQ